MNVNLVRNKLNTNYTLSNVVLNTFKLNLGPTACTTIQNLKTKNFVTNFVLPYMPHLVWKILV